MKSLGFSQVVLSANGLCSAFSHAPGASTTTWGWCSVNAEVKAVRWRQSSSVVVLPDSSRRSKDPAMPQLGTATTRMSALAPVAVRHWSRNAVISGARSSEYTRTRKVGAGVCSGGRALRAAMALAITRRALPSAHACW